MTDEEVKDHLGEPVTILLRNRANERVVGSAVIGSVDLFAGSHLVRIPPGNQQDVAIGDLIGTLRGPKGEMPLEVDLTHSIPRGADCIRLILNQAYTDDVS